MEKLTSRAFAAIIAVGIAFMAAGPVGAFAALETNYSWYKGHEADASYTIGTAGEMKALAKLVNGTADYDGDGTVDAAVDFAGKSIAVADPTNLTKHLNFVEEGIEPIGTAAHPFKGAFDGNGFTADNFKLVIAADDASTPASNVGLFGYVGEGGSVSNVNVGSFAGISIARAAATKEYVENVGMVVGYCAGSVTNCSNSGALTVTSSVAQKGAGDYIPVRNVGGVVGQCVFDVTGCSNSGAVSVTEDASPDADIAHGQLAARIGGVVGLAGDATRIGTYDSHVYGEPGKHGAVSACANTGMVFVDTPKIGGLDRFGQQTNAESVAVGGVVGYSQGSVTRCTNGRAKEPELGSTDLTVGYVRAENGVQVGGVCGSLRGVLSDNMNVAYADDGADGKDPLVMDGCTNYGDVYARVTAGGIVGKSSSYTTVTECLNLNKTDAFGNVVGSFVIATRWNKPAPGGIVGTANGEVSYCANLATVASASWKDEGKRTLNTQDGYYAAGIAGMLTYFGDQAAAKGGVTTPVAELYGCYNAGTITAGAGMRQRGIVGENNGYVHDNALLSGVVDEDKLVYGDSPGDKEASGTTGDNRVYEADELRGDASAAAVAFLNSNSLANGWTRYWVVSKDAAAKGLNGGFPLLDRQNPWGDDEKVRLADATLELVSDATYTGGESLPEVKVTLQVGSESRELVENADYRVVPETGAIDPTSGRPYTAYAVGLGRYTGTSTAGVKYGIKTGDFSKCTVTAVAHTFDYTPQVPSADDVTVRTPAGTVVDPGEYTFRLVDADGQPVEAVDVDSYRLLVEPKAGSSLFAGTLEGTFRVKTASFMTEVKFDDVVVSYLGEDYKWVDSTKKGESEDPTTTLPYTGVSVQPDVSNVTYNGHTLVEGEDYKLVYGNPNSDDGNTGGTDEANLGKAGGKTAGWVTVRYISGKKTNFSSYANMCFWIDGTTQAKTDLSHATYRVEEEQVYDGQPHRPVELYLGRTKLTEGVDYSIEYADEVYPGTASFTATGIGTFEGRLSGEFEIKVGELVTPLYSYSGTGAADSPYEATVTGAEYNGNRDAFSLVIPGEVEHDGHAYAVTAVGEKAFGGSSSTEFEGSVANESKAKLESVFIPASVRVLGPYAFGSAWSGSDLALSSVEFAEGSQLTEVGMRAFGRCGRLERLTVPAQMATIGRNAFCESGLKELRFLTTSADLPATVATGANGAFGKCYDVVVYGYAQAANVKALAEANSGAKDDSSGRHENGGSGFTFVGVSSMQDAVVADIPDQVFTGSAVEPATGVDLNGRRLVRGVDYEVSYSENVSVGTARAIVKGIGTWGGQIEKTFAIVPAPMGKVEFSKLVDKGYDGEAASFAPRLTHGGYRLTEGVDYELSYADGDGNAIGAPVEPGTYRLVATGKGNFTGTGYRWFRIVTASLANAEVSVIGQPEYTGTPAMPDVNVSIGGKYLERDRDFVLSYSDNTEVGEGQVLVRGIGEYEGSKSVRFRIVGASLEDASVIGVDDVRFTGEPVGFSPVVIDGGRLLAEGTDYTVSYQRVAEAGTLAAALAGGLGAGAGVAAAGATDLEGPPSERGSYRLVVTGVGNCRSSASAEFDIVDGDVAGKVNLSAALVSVPGSPVDYDGSALTPAAKVSLGGSELVAGRDYVAAYSGNVLPSTASEGGRVVVYGTGGYTGSASAEFTVAGVPLAAENVGDVTGAYYLGGDAVEPALVVRANGRSLAEGTDYTVEYSNNTGVGEAKATVTGLNGYAGSPVEKAFAIARADVSQAGVEVADQVYDGTRLAPAVTVTMGGRVLDAQSDYGVEYENNVDAGTASFVVTGKGNYAGKLAGQFAIAPRSLKGDDVRVTVGAQTYSGSKLEPPVTVRVGSAILGSGDYSAEYSNNVNAGYGKVTVTGRGNYRDSVEQSFVINPVNISGATVSVSGATYTGAALKPPVTVRLGGAALPASCYSVAYSSNVNAGTGKIAVKGVGNYAGTAGGTFAIAPADLSRATVSVAKATYTGKALRPKVTVRLGGAVLAAGNYKVAYSNNKNASTAKSKAKATVTGVGNYKGTASAAFSIAPKAPSLKVTGTSKTVKASAAKKKAQTLKLAVKSASKGKVTYKLKKSSKKVAFKSGKATLKKGTKKGKYSIKVTVKQAAKGNYAKATKTVTVTFKVK